MNKQQLASKIWNSANNMRGKIEANEYKDYILGFIFYKFLSETEIARLRREGFTEADLPTLVEDDAELVQFTKDVCGYFIAYEHLFDTWVARGKDLDIMSVRDAFSAFGRNIDANRKRVFDGIFDTLQTGLSKLGADARGQSKAVRDLIGIIKDIPMQGRQDYDVLGFIYEFLISNFAANAGKKAGEFYTPHEVSQLMSEIVAWHLDGRDTMQIYDPTSGSGSLLITIGQSVARRSGDPDSIKYYAQELTQSTYNLTRMNLVMRGILPDNIVTRNGDTLADDWPWFESDETKDETYEPLFVDAVVSNPPYSQRWNPPATGEDPRFEYGIAPVSKADYAFLLHDLYHLRPDGIMTIVLPHGVLFRGGEEGSIRKSLVEHHHIQAIIGLPANIFFGTGIPTIVMVLRKQRAESDVLIVDASKHFVKDGKQNKLAASDIKRIVDVVTTAQDREKFSRLVGIDEIRANDYNLNIPRYVDSSEATEAWDLYASMFGGVPKAEADALQGYWDAWPSLKGQLFDDDGSPYLHSKVNDAAEIVRGNADVGAFRAQFLHAVDALPTLLRTRLIDDVQNVDTVSEEGAIAHTLEEMLAEVPLIDPYAAYQVLDDAWSGIAGDVEVLQAEGLDAVRTVDPNMVEKKKNNESVTVQDGWIGRILPFDVVQHHLLADKLDAIDHQKRRLDAIDQELAEILDDMDAEEKSASDAVGPDGDKFVAAELKKAAKAIGKHPESDFDRALVRAQALSDEARRTKKSMKQTEGDLEDATKSAIEGLDDAACRDMLAVKWIAPLMDKLERLPEACIDVFVSQVVDLGKKYQDTYAGVCDQIRDAEAELSDMLGQLTGNDFDMAGIAELKRILDGE